MRALSTSVGLVAAVALAAGGWGMAQAAPHDAHEGAGNVGENRDLRPKRATGDLPKLVGIVNDARDIEISDRTPSPGRYKIVVRDSTRSHNWHLYGNGISIASTVRGEGRWVFKIRLRAGSYRVVCDPHFDDMEFDLVVR